MCIVKTDGHIGKYKTIFKKHTYKLYTQYGAKVLIRVLDTIFFLSIPKEKKEEKYRLTSMSTTIIQLLHLVYVNNDDNICRH